jgi:RNA polymerase sigma-70 factor (ECF subfamily)
MVNADPRERESSNRRAPRRPGIRELAIDADDEATEASSRAGRSPEDETTTRDVLERAFDRLDVDARSLLVLHHLDNRSIEDIAQVLEIPTGTVKSRLSKARADLEQALALENR